MSSNPRQGYFQEATATRKLSQPVSAGQLIPSRKYYLDLKKQFKVKFKMINFQERRKR
jgi:hypothetical protein